MTHQTFDLLGVHVAVTNLDATCRFMEQKIKAGDSSYICIVPVATIVDCQKDQEYLKVINHASMATPDGMPVVWVGKMKGNPTIERTYGPDLMDRFCRLHHNKPYKHFLYGGTEETSQRLEAELKRRFPKMNIVGRYAPPFREAHEIEAPEMIDHINALKPDILWVGLGSPKQDFWMCQHQKKLRVGVMVGVGAAFDFLAGTKKQAPVWMRKTGLEWFFRLCSEPRRLWKRYLIGNTRFIFYLVKNIFRPRHKKRISDD
jgi:N-acetylglucosaminyldiphosphoundecaprenol N-acetyl-beta-D-mannosaminyltransferase